MSDTPETDADLRERQAGGWGGTSPGLTRALERERDQLEQANKKHYDAMCSLFELAKTAQEICAKQRLELTGWHPEEVEQNLQEEPRWRFPWERTSQKKPKPIEIPQNDLPPESNPFPI